MFYWLTLIQSLPPLPSLEEPAALETRETVAVLEETPLLPAPAVGQLGGLGVLASGSVVTFVVLLLVAIWAYTRVYVITPTNEAFVRTGGIVRKQKKVILNGGCVVLPGFHELTRVPLRELSIDVERTGKLAVRTQDYLRADMRVTFYVCINASEDDVLTAAARLSREGQITPEDIKNALEKRADDGIRAAAKTKTLAETDSDKLGFAQEVLNLIEPDLKKVGLTLNNLAISEIEESDTYDTNNFFDAQGVRLRTETIQRSIQQKREVELT
ncbi:MAG: SPFH domain-containing protein, partial [Cyanobacteria bacterium P01_A01_bin.70]